MAGQKNQFNESIRAFCQRKRYNKTAASPLKTGSRSIDLAKKPPRPAIFLGFNRLVCIKLPSHAVAI